MIAYHHDFLQDTAKIISLQSELFFRLKKPGSYFL